MAARRLTYAGESGPVRTLPALGESLATSAGIPPFTFLVDVDQHVVAEHPPEPRLFHIGRPEHRVAVRQDRRGTDKLRAP